MTDTPATDTPATEPATAVATAEPPATDAPPAPEVSAAVVGPAKPPRKAVQVPVWVLGAVLGLVLVVGAFFVGRSTAPDSGDSGPATLAEAVELTASGEMSVGDFDGRALLQALSRNDQLDLGIIGDLLLGGGGRR